MKNSTLPKTVKIKKIARGETVYIQNGLASNGHWIVSTAWLLGLKRRRDLGMTSFCNRIARAQANAVQARLSDERFPTHDLESILRGLDLSEYRPAKSFEFLFGFIRGNAQNYDAAALSFGVKDTPFLDIEYSALCYMDTEAVVLVKDSKSPVILQKASGDIVAVIAPLNPDKIKQYLGEE